MLFAVIMAVTGCTSLRTASDFDKKTDFTQYKTYGFYDKGIARLSLNDLDKQRLISSVETEMNAKGFTKSDRPDLLVNLVVVSRLATDVYDYGNRFYGFGWGWRYPFFGGGMTSVNQYSEGTIIIDFLDPKLKTVIWHGRGAGFNLDNFNKREERVHKGVTEILAQYPPNKK